MTEQGKARILIIDDDAAALETFSELLETVGYHVEGTGSATHALELLENKTYHLIITDLVMPQMDGISLIKNIKSLGIDIPIIVMTGFATIEHAVESMKAGAFDFITKPFNLEQIKIIITKTFENRRLQKMAEEWEYYKDLSNRDDLTQLSNYRHFMETLEKEINRTMRYNRPLSLLMIDIDDFKAYNDSYGHLVGDIVLKQISAIIKKNTRGCDLAARYGGEEFCVILPETTETETKVVAERIREGIADYHLMTGEGTPVGKLSVTIGLSSMPDKATTKRELIKTADKALYQGKTTGKNRVVVYTDKGQQCPQ